MGASHGGGVCNRGRKRLAPEEHAAALQQPNKRQWRSPNGEGRLNEGEHCPICGTSIGKGGSLARVEEADSHLIKRCHVYCVRELLNKPESKKKFELDPTFAESLRDVLTSNPELNRKFPTVSIANEEIRMASAALRWPPEEMEEPSSTLYIFEGVTEFRVSSCPALLKLPKEIGFCHNLKYLVLISNGLSELPAEVGALKFLIHLFLNGNFLRTLPKEVGALESLQEICLDANLIEVLPPITSTHLTLFTAPANRLREFPEISGRLNRLELHGNCLQSLSLICPEAKWDKILSLKLMGNRLQELPEALGEMEQLQTLMVPGNRLKAIPSSVTKLSHLQWIFAYNNCLESLPTGMLTGSNGLQRVMLEGNPLTQEALGALFEEARHSWVGTLSMDSVQVQGFLAAREEAHKDLPEGEVPKLQPLPWSVSVGDLVGIDVGDRFFMKLMRASQMKRKYDVALPEQHGQLGGQEAKLPLLIVGFAASQGEPEWLGVLRKLAESGTARRLPSTAGPLSEVVGEDVLTAGTLADEVIISKLWSQCGAVGDEKANTTEQGAEENGTSQVFFEDFDVLAVIDHTMSWYDDPSGGFRASLKKVMSNYRRTLFLGASMGGYGAMLHGGRLADAVVAFSPQSRLDTATLRPAAADFEALKARHQELCDSVEAATARGAIVEVHCAADEHCWHGLNIPLANQALTVHPMLPRKPWARILDRAGLLEPILSDAICRLLAPEAEPAAQAMEPVCPSSCGEKQITVARWACGGRFSRHWTTRDCILKLMFAKGAPYMPRPGDWFCPQCSTRNVSNCFFCTKCPSREKGPNVTDKTVRVIPGLGAHLRKGDWGCGNCLAKNCSYDRTCSSWSCQGKGDHPGTIVIP